ncbi:hypothetical protein K7432_003322 [Basidiobolus ranarum]|uniref:Homeobox domain-containing protein n=1 Tax=Basidiobolus ranarum TaxID=34480 RepID=A0ABR2X022_9FUNG
MLSNYSVDYSDEPPAKKHRNMLPGSISQNPDLNEISGNFLNLGNPTFPFTHSSSITHYSQEYEGNRILNMGAGAVSVKDDKHSKSEASPSVSSPKGTKSSEDSENPSRSEEHSSHSDFQDEFEETIDQTREDTNEGNTSGKENSSSNSTKKRTRASPEQLAILEDAFMTNTSPNSKVREALAERIKMSERSIQIWFQNRRAKVKLMQKRSHLLQQEAISRQYFNSCMPMFSNGVYPFRNDMRPSQSGMYSNNSSAGYTPMVDMTGNQCLSSSASPNSYQYNPASMSMNSNSTPGVNGSPSLLMQSNVAKSVAMMRSMSAPTTPNTTPTDGTHLFACDTLGVGTWRRMAVTKNDLLCYFNLNDKKMSWQITDNSSRFKMEFPFSSVVGIEYKALDVVFGQIIIDINQVPEFSMEVKVGSNPIWTPCRDFTEGKQASRFFRHIIRGHAQPLKRQIVTLMQADMNLQKIVRIEPLSSSSSNMSQMMVPQRRQSFPDKSISSNFDANNSSLLAARRASVDDYMTRRAVSVPMLNLMNLSGSSRESSLSADMYNSLMTINENENESPMNSYAKHSFNPNNNTSTDNSIVSSNFNDTNLTSQLSTTTTSPSGMEIPLTEALMLTSPLDLYQNHRYDLQMMPSSLGVSGSLSSSLDETLALNSMYLMGNVKHASHLNSSELNNGMLGQMLPSHFASEFLSPEEFEHRDGTQ